MLQTVSDLIRNVARDVLMPLHGRLRAEDIHEHSDGSLFTAADLEAERRLVAGLGEIFPDTVVLGEEQISENPAFFLNKMAGRTFFMIDPVDGTNAFKRGDDTYGVMISRIENGRTSASWIYCPGTADFIDGRYYPRHDVMITARLGGGCFIDGEKVSFSGRPQILSGANIAFACRNQDASHEAILAAGVPGYQPRSNAADDYRRILQGELDAVFYAEGQTPRGDGKCPPWDHAAGVLAVQEAGGFVGLPYPGTPAYDPLRCHDRLLVAASLPLFDAVLTHIRKNSPSLCHPHSWNFPDRNRSNSQTQPSIKGP